MSENIVNILESIREIKGEEYVEGLVDMANLLAPRKTEEHHPGGCRGMHQIKSEGESALWKF